MFSRKSKLEPKQNLNRIIMDRVGRDNFNNKALDRPAQMMPVERRKLEPLHPWGQNHN